MNRIKEEESKRQAIASKFQVMCYYINFSTYVTSDDTYTIFWLNLITI